MYIYKVNYQIHLVQQDEETQSFSSSSVQLYIYIYSLYYQKTSKTISYNAIMLYKIKFRGFAVWSVTTCTTKLSSNN